MKEKVGKVELSRARPQLREVIRRRVAGAVIAGLLIWTAIVWIHGARAIFRFYSPLPYWDYWDTVGHLDQYHRFDWTVLWQLHNEHRIVFPEVIFALDYLLFKGQEILPLVISALCYAGTWLIFCAALARSNTPPTIRVCAILLAAIVMGWQGAPLLLASPFLVQWSLTLAAGAASLFLLAQAPASRHSVLWLAAAIACAAVATYTSASGLILWPVLLLAALFLHLNKIQVTVVLITGAVLSGLYFVGFHFPHQTHASTPLSHPLYAIAFIAAYLGMPFTIIRPHLGVYSGLIGLGAYVVLVIAAWRRRLVSTTPGIVLLGFYLFCLLMAVMTAAGRMNPQDPKLIAATAQRYSVMPLAAWAVLILASAWLLGGTRRQLWAVAIGLYALGFALIPRSPHPGLWVRATENLFANCQLAALGFESGIRDIELMRDVFSDPGYPREKMSTLQKYRVSIFADRKTGWLGKPAASVFSHVSDRLEDGAVTAVYPVESGLMVLGWTDAARRILHPQQLVFLNEQKQIVGFGSKLTAGLPRELGSLNTPGALAWVGFVNLNFPAKSFSTYVVEAHGRALAPIGETLPVPSVKVVFAAHAGPVLPAISWEVEGSWKRDGPFPVRPPDLPSSEVYYESWNGSDANTGRLASTVFAKPASNCLVIPAAHGPTIEGLSIEVLDADTGRTAASLPLYARDLLWRQWQVALPAELQQVRIVASDQSHLWGGWLAIGQVRGCQ